MYHLFWNIYTIDTNEVAFSTELPTTLKLYWRHKTKAFTVNIPAYYNSNDSVKGIQLKPACLDPNYDLAYWMLAAFPNYDCAGRQYK